MFQNKGLNIKDIRMPVESLRPWDDSKDFPQELFDATVKYVLDDSYEGRARHEVLEFMAYLKRISPERFEKNRGAMASVLGIEAERKMAQVVTDYIDIPNTRQYGIHGAIQNAVQRIQDWKDLRLDSKIYARLMNKLQPRGIEVGDACHVEGEKDNIREVYEIFVITRTLVSLKSIDFELYDSISRMTLFNAGRCWKRALEIEPNATYKSVFVLLAAALKELDGEAYHREVEPHLNFRLSEVRKIIKPMKDLGDPVGGDSVAVMLDYEYAEKVLLQDVDEEEAPKPPTPRKI